MTSMVNCKTYDDFRASAMEPPTANSGVRVVLETFLLFGSGSIVTYDLWLMAPLISGFLQ
jgi:hypothetical protein